MSKTVKFLNFLKEQDPNSIIYFGTENGSSWLAIETAQTLIDKMDIMEKKLHRRSENILENAKDRILVIPSQLIEERNKLNELERTGATREDINKAKTKVYDLEKGFVSAFSTRKKYQKYLDCWVKLSNRKVVESYPHTVDVPGISVLVEGIEDGALWMKREKGKTSLIDE